MGTVSKSIMRGMTWKAHKMILGLLALTIPSVLPGTLTGVWIYNKLSEVNFKRVVFILLMLVGATLVIKGWAGIYQ
jgi:uncharacterized membrane protein YfcA